ncbi:hypothetical protein B0H14DRAFT_3468474 [Mycena olivaceomarginata]|nr:hypothetical protein B0H14DRAFT_3468474 [Mycena olivaceomarginata]
MGCASHDELEDKCTQFALIDDNIISPPPNANCVPQLLRHLGGHIPFVFGALSLAPPTLLHPSVFLVYALPPTHALRAAVSTPPCTLLAKPGPGSTAPGEREGVYDTTRERERRDRGGLRG